MLPLQAVLRHNSFFYMSLINRKSARNRFRVYQNETKILNLILKFYKMLSERRSKFLFKKKIKIILS